MTYLAPIEPVSINVIGEDGFMYDNGYGGIMPNASASRGPFGGKAPKAPISEEGQKAILSSVQQELQRLVSQEKFGPKQLCAIARLAEMAREMIVDLAVEIKDVAAQMAAGGELPELGEGITSLDGALSPGTFPETYGGGVLRQLLPALKDMAPKKDPDPLSDMVAAAATARAEGLDELANDIIASIRARMSAKKATAKQVKEPNDAVVSPKLEG